MANKQISNSNSYWLVDIFLGFLFLGAFILLFSGGELYLPGYNLLRLEIEHIIFFLSLIFLIHLSFQVSKRNFKPFLNALIGYFFLSLAYTWPLVLHLPRLLHQGRGDAPIFLWNFWWFRKALVGLGESPLDCEYLFAPFGCSLVFNTNHFFNSVISLPWQYAFGDISALNFCLLFSLWASAFGTFCLVRYLTKNNWAAFYSGAAFGFCNFLLCRSIGHYNLLSAWSFPFTILFLLEGLWQRKLKYFIFSGLILGLTIYADYYYFIFDLLLVLLTILIETKATGWRFFSKKYLFNTSALFLTVLLLTLPLLYPSWILLKENNSWLSSPLSSSLDLSADLLSYITPYSVSLLYKNYISSLLDKFNWLSTNFLNIENIAFLGFLNISLLLISIFGQPFNRNRLWLWIILVFGSLSLGPLIHINGKFIFSYEDLKISIPLPFLIFHKIPFLSGIRAPSRFAILVMFAASVLAGLGLSWLLHKINKRRSEPFTIFTNLAIIILLISILFIETTWTPLSLNELEPPDVYYEIADLAGDWTILQLPLGWTSGSCAQGYSSTENNSLLLSFQRAHQKKQIGGYTSRLGEETFAYFKNLPVIRELIKLQEGSTAGNQGQTVSWNELQTAWQAAPAVFELLDIRAVVILKQYLKNENIIEQFLLKSFPEGQVIKNNEKVLAFLIQPKSELEEWDSINVLEPDLVRQSLVLFGLYPMRLGNKKDQKAYHLAQETQIIIPNTEIWKENYLQVNIKSIPIDTNTETKLNIFIDKQPKSQRCYRQTLNLSKENSENSFLIPKNFRQKSTPKMSLKIETSSLLSLTKATLLEVRSAGYYDGNFSNILINGREYSLQERGYNFVLVDQDLSKIKVAEHLPRIVSFDTCGDPQASQKLIKFLNDLPAKGYLIASVRDDASSNLSYEAAVQLWNLGCRNIPYCGVDGQHEKENFRAGHAFIINLDPEKGWIMEKGGFGKHSLKYNPEGLIIQHLEISKAVAPQAIPDL